MLIIFTCDTSNIFYETLFQNSPIQGLGVAWFREVLDLDIFKNKVVHYEFKCTLYFKRLVKQAESCWTVSVTAFLIMVLITPFSLGQNFIPKLGSVVRVMHCSSVMQHKAFHVQATGKWEK